MAYYKPCKNCSTDKSSCPRRAEIAKAVAGLSVTVVNFRCRDRLPLFHSGQRVAFTWTFWEPSGGYEEYHGLGLVYHGTVIEEHALRFIVRVDDAPSADVEKIAARDTFKSDNLVIKVRPADMRALDEPDRQLCPACIAYPDEASRCQGWGEPGGFGSYWPTGCLVRQAQKLEAAE
jgi:hypothetical protein